MQLGLPFTDVRPKADTPSDGSGPLAALAPSAPLPPSHLQFLFVRNRRARRYLVRVDADGRVRVTIPRGGSRREAGEFAGRHLDWIHRQRARVLSHDRLALSEGERRALRERAGAVLPERLRRLAAEHGLVVTRVTIRNQRSRWGSCGRDGHICLNWRLVLMPDWVRDYVIVHELMHLRRMDHSPAYWRHVAAALPDYDKARRWLREHGPGLR